MPRAPGPLKTRPTCPGASSGRCIWTRAHTPRSQKITRATALAESRMWLLGPQWAGRGPPPGEGTSREVRWHHRDVAGLARLREREAVQGHGQRYFRSPHFRLRCSGCRGCRPPVERLPVRVSSEVGQREAVTVAVVPRPGGAEVRGGRGRRKRPGSRFRSLLARAEATSGSRGRDNPRRERCRLACRQVRAELAGWERGGGRLLGGGCPAGRVASGVRCSYFHRPLLSLDCVCHLSLPRYSALDFYPFVPLVTLSVPPKQPGEEVGPAFSGRHPPGCECIEWGKGLQDPGRFDWVSEWATLSFAVQPVLRIFFPCLRHCLSPTAVAPAGGSSGSGAGGSLA